MATGERASFWLAALRMLVLVALAASSALYVDYANVLPTFCAVGSGCSAVRTSGYGYVLGWVPVPLAGILAFGTLLVTSLLGPSRFRYRLLVLAGYSAGIGGLGFIVLQLAIGAFCGLCMIADGAAVAISGVTFAYQKAIGPTRRASDEGDPLEPWAWAVLSVVAVLGPLLWATVKPQPDVPAPVLALFAPGKINVIEFSDFECPFCRLLHQRLKVLLGEYGSRVNLVRLHVPLDMHPDARSAARAAICAERQGEGDRMADELFESEDLSPESNRERAELVGLDLELYDRCVVDPAVDERIARHVRLFKDIGRQGLPTLFIGSREFVGLQEPAVLKEALARTADNEDTGGIPPALYVLLVATTLVVAGVFGRRRARRGKVKATETA